MKVIHGTWIPASAKKFIQTGQFSIWLETDEVKPKKTSQQHPQQFVEKEGLAFLKAAFSYALKSGDSSPQLQSIYLPTLNNKPIPSPELSTIDIDGALKLQAWQVLSYPLPAPLKNLGDIYFLSHYQHEDIRVGRDFLFWYYFSQSLKQVLYKDQYIPGLVAEAAKTKTNLYRCWKIISPGYEALIEQSVAAMPLACAQNHQSESLLRHFAEVMIHQLLDASVKDLPGVFRNKVQNDFLQSIIFDEQIDQPLRKVTKIPEEFQQWHLWQRKLLSTQQKSSLQLGFQLYEADAKQVDNWRLSFVLGSYKDPSFKLDLADFWADGDNYHKLITKQLGAGVEQQILVNLAHAARIYPKLWLGMETAEPANITLSLDEAFEFLQEWAWVLEDAGFRIIIPARLTPKGRQRAKMRLRSGNSKSTSNKSAKSYLSLDDLTNYHYEFAIGDEKVSVEEWQQLVEMKMSLVYFRGQWVELDQDKMQQMLAFWQQQQEQPETLSVQELLQKLAEEGDSLEVDANDSLADMMAHLNNHSELALIDNPPLLKAQLRDYQKRGVSWLRYLESLGLNGCLADDMGLGKTMQVIAALILEKQEGTTGPTLLIAPTSVIGNWQKEIHKFAPHLNTFIHHGSQREKDQAAFNDLCNTQDMLITSYTLVRKDSALLNSINWHRVVLDEAQNIKNPKAAQTKAILKLEAEHRLALTGTPVENRLMDLWSIFNFLNPNYLGKQAQFRKNYELPIQRDNNQVQSTVLKQLIQPFILRRLKTDKSIIKDLPDKIENKQYCNLSKEQASLYQAVVSEVEEQLEDSEGIQRQGLMLSTLMKLKQVCNHPTQFLQDDSPFSAERSHKLERLTEMLAEAIAEGDSVLIFTQFTEIGDKLSHYLSQEQHYPCQYLHGGIARKRREKMIEDFQDPESPPSVFVLSLKAGGVGITLTRANHVFHFDRWWNPAVENQATDRAFRIGQKKKVMVHKFITLGTLEERIDQMIEEKQKMADSIIGNDESWLTKLDNQAFKELIALNKNSIMEA
ncbi:DEAD/DEAH box helicase [Methyloprofundus sp.]|uniref:DEAD/DEAH box helicase n=1 Tax=Methyloprofundus sp. TaxID=2020875 RepID=UPI003D12E50C